jgi:hypothetical protein
MTTPSASRRARREREIKTLDTWFGVIHHGLVWGIGTTPEEAIAEAVDWGGDEMEDPDAWDAYSVPPPDDQVFLVPVTAALVERVTEGKHDFRWSKGQATMPYKERK